MNRLLDTEEDELPRPRRRAEEPADREISLGTTMLLGIFFFLVLLCAGFFGLGYSMGQKSVHNSPAIASAATNSLYTASKPAPGKSTLDSTTAPAPAAPKPATAPETVELPYTPPSVSTTAPIERVAPVAAAPAATPAPPAAAPTAAPAAAPPVPGVTYMVQIAAVTHQEDADMLVSALKGRGYAVAIHTGPQDKFLHVQVGPFVTRKDADAMRQRLQGDGFNAIVK